MHLVDHTTHRSCCVPSVRFDTEGTRQLLIRQVDVVIDSRSGGFEPTAGPERQSGVSISVWQLGILGVAADRLQTPRHRSPFKCVPHAQQECKDPLLETYQRRLAARGAAPKGMAAYQYQLQWMLRFASLRTGKRIAIGDLFGAKGLLGVSLIADVAISDGRRLSKWTLAQRRSALRSFVNLMCPELRALLSEDPHQILTRELQSVAERVGGGFRLSGGAPRRRGGLVPTSAEIHAVITMAGQAPGFRGLRNRAFFEILAGSGARVNALLRLDGADCIAIPSGRLRLFLHEKGKLQQREVELGRAEADALIHYIETYNRYAANRGWQARIRLGVPGSVWRNSGCGTWPYGDVLRTLRSSCHAASITVFTPHAVRRTFATDASEMLPRHIVALAGGWEGIERLDDHYIRPSQDRVWDKLFPALQDDLEREGGAGASREAIAAVL